ncbi:hypothetical protein ACWJXY_15965 [Clostridioides difficile]|nr:hypothetical protein [Clostridioides difficile]VIG74010.1 Uncharacterised protein [Clostridioides difficile]VII01110.1 Uncharacterised protein [Clostridioides difficile]HAU5240704.1 hypothetical protein [Clostridioides difficile]HAU5290143.1 hypothetical protein [Clostridioides difficile]
MRNNLKEKELDELEVELNRTYDMYVEMCLLGASKEVTRYYERRIKRLMIRWNELKEESK